MSSEGELNDRDCEKRRTGKQTKCPALVQNVHSRATPYKAAAHNPLAHGKPEVAASASRNAFQAPPVSGLRDSNAASYNLGRDRWKRPILLVKLCAVESEMTPW